MTEKCKAQFAPGIDCCLLLSEHKGRRHQTKGHVRWTDEGVVEVDEHGRANPPIRGPIRDGHPYDLSRGKKGLAR